MRRGKMLRRIWSGAVWCVGEEERGEADGQVDGQLDGQVEVQMVKGSEWVAGWSAWQEEDVRVNCTHTSTNHHALHPTHLLPPPLAHPPPPSTCTHLTVVHPPANQPDLFTLLSHTSQNTAVTPHYHTPHDDTLNRTHAHTHSHTLSNPAPLRHHPSQHRHCVPHTTHKLLFTTLTTTFPTLTPSVRTRTSLFTTLSDQHHP